MKKSLTWIIQPHKNDFMNTKNTFHKIAELIETTGAVAGIMGFVVLAFAFCIEETTRAGYWIAVFLVLFGSLMVVFAACLKDCEKNRDF